MRKSLFLVFIVMVSSFVIACSPITVDDYEGVGPSIAIEDFFEGDLVAFGIVRNRSGKVIRHFEAALKGSFTGQAGVVTGSLDEVFWFDDGERQTRLWEMTRTGDGDYVGTAGDVEGQAVIQTRGNAIRLNYQLRVPYKDDEIIVSMDDWMYQIVPGVVINETVMTKWGFEVGKVTLVIMRADAATQVPALVERFDQ